jgi:O-antigen ligase
LNVRAGLVLALMVGLAASITLAETALVLLAAWLAFGARRTGATGAGWPLLGPLAVFAGWTVVAALASARPLESLLAARGLLTLGALYVVFRVLPDVRAAERFAIGLFATVTVVALLSIAQVAFCPAEEAVTSVPAALGWFMRKCGRARGFFSIYMTLAGVLMLVLLSALPRVAYGGRTLVWGLPAWLAGVLALALTSVRGAWVGFAVGAAGCVIALRRRWVVLAAVVFVVVAAGTVTGDYELRKRVRSFGDLANDTTRDRLAMLGTGLGLAIAHPITGIGPGQVKHVYPAVASPAALRRSTSHLHNAPLQIAVERGLPGLAAWVAIWVGFFGAAVRVLRRIPATDQRARALVLGSMAAIGAFLVAGLFEYNFGDTEVLLVALSLMALPFVVERELRPMGDVGRARQAVALDGAREQPGRPARG